MGRNSTYSCPHVALDEFRERMAREMWQLNGIMLLNVIVMGLVVFIGVCSSRYRRHPIIGFIFRGANTLFLPIVSIAAGREMTDFQSATTYYLSGEKVIAQCNAGFHDILVLVWTGLVVFVLIHNSAVVAGDPREGRNVKPSSDLLTQAIWVVYLIVEVLLRPSSFRYRKVDISGEIIQTNISLQIIFIFGTLISCSLSKIIQKYRVFYVARGSFILGRNPRLIVSYMDQLEEHVVPPSLIVMEGGSITLQQQPRGCYSFIIGTPKAGHKQQIEVKTENGSKLVTLDTVWKLDDNHFSSSSTQAKDLCFSFALFKLLRCLFAKYSVYEAGFTKARNLFWDTYLQQKNDNYSRVFRVIADELSFFHDYYDSSMSIPFLHHRFLLGRVVNQFLSMGCCILILALIIRTWGFFGSTAQVFYRVTCAGRKGNVAYIPFGHYHFDVIPVCFVLAAILISEMREIVSYICCNFTKVVRICNYVNNSRCRKFVLFVFKYMRCEWLLNNWDDKMSQCKLLVFCPWQVSILWRRLVRLPNQKKIKVPSEVKEYIFKALQGLDSEHEGQALKHIRFPRSPIHNPATVDARLACDGKGAADTILAWHIATSIFEVRQQLKDHLLRCKTAAVRLSQYCAYLVCCHPELLPDDVEWCKTLHKAVKKEAARVLAKCSAAPAPGEDQFQHMVDSLSAESKHEVLSHGARLAQQLVDSGKGWEELAQFWSEMILYIAPSEKLDEHAEAISRGGELVTLVWALLAHAGIVERLDDADATAATSGADARV